MFIKTYLIYKYLEDFKCKYSSFLLNYQMFLPKKMSFNTVFYNYLIFFFTKLVDNYY